MKKRSAKKEIEKDSKRRKINQIDENIGCENSKRRLRSNNIAEPAESADNFEPDAHSTLMSNPEVEQFSYVIFLSSEVMESRFPGLSKSRSELNSSGQSQSSSNSSDQCRNIRCNSGQAQCFHGSQALLLTSDSLRRVKVLQFQPNDWQSFLLERIEQNGSSSSGQYRSTSHSSEQIRNISNNSVQTPNTSNSLSDFSTEVMDPIRRIVQDGSSNLPRQLEQNDDVLPSQPINGHQEMEDLNNKLTDDGFCKRFIEALKPVALNVANHKLPITRIFSRLISANHLRNYVYTQKKDGKIPLTPRFNSLLDAIYKTLLEVDSGYNSEKYKNEIKKNITNKPRKAQK